MQIKKLQIDDRFNNNNNNSNNKKEPWRFFIIIIIIIIIIIYDFKEFYWAVYDAQYKQFGRGSKHEYLYMYTKL